MLVEFPTAELKVGNEQMGASVKAGDETKTYM